MLRKSLRYPASHFCVPVLTNLKVHQLFTLFFLSVLRTELLGQAGSPVECTGGTPKVLPTPPPQPGCFSAWGSAVSRGNSEWLRPLFMVAWAVTSHTVTALLCPSFPPYAATAILVVPAGARALGGGEQRAGWGMGSFIFLSSWDFFLSFPRPCFPPQFCLSISCTRVLKVQLFMDPLCHGSCQEIASSDVSQAQSFCLTILCSKAPKAWQTSVS